MHRRPNGMHLSTCSLPMVPSCPTISRTALQSMLVNVLGMISFALVATVFDANAQTPSQGLSRPPLIIAPTVEGMLLCDEAVAQANLSSMEVAYAYCRQRKLDGAPAVLRLLDTLEPGGPRGGGAGGLHRHPAAAGAVPRDP